MWAVTKGFGHVENTQGLEREHSEDQADKGRIVGTEHGGEISVDEIQFTDDARQLPGKTQKLNIH